MDSLALEGWISSSEETSILVLGEVKNRKQHFTFGIEHIVFYGLWLKNETFGSKIKPQLLTTAFIKK